jgi:ATPases with chaperone activity, ATP-binding subunit
MFERFTENAIKSIMYAQEESRRLGHNHVGSEMLLLGLMRLGSDPVLNEDKNGLGEEALARTGLELNDVRSEVEKIIGRGSGYENVEMPFTERSKVLLENSWNEARLLDVNYIGTEHLLLGLLRETEISKKAGKEIGVAAKVLEAKNIDLSELRQTVIKLVKEG